MAGTIMSNFMMFLPEKTKWFCLIGMCIFFFGIYIPYEEYKKKKKQRQKNHSKNQKQIERTDQTADQKKLEQLKALKKAGLLSEEEYQAKKRNI